MSVPVYVVLLHFPVVNRNGVRVTTAVTNMDIHDISRSAQTFGVKGFFLVTPIEDQHELVGRILTHWRTDRSRLGHPDRHEAISLVRLAKTFAEAKVAIQAENAWTGEGTENLDPEVVLTDARPLPDAIDYAVYRRELEGRRRTLLEKKPVVLVFGTGWGVAEDFYPEVNRVLKPIYGPRAEDPNGRGYNHLSVRAAAAIVLDRLFGE